MCWTAGWSLDVSCVSDAVALDEKETDLSEQVNPNFEQNPNIMSKNVKFSGNVEVFEFNTFGKKGIVFENMDGMETGNFMGTGFGHAHGFMLNDKVMISRFEDDMLASPPNDFVEKPDQHVLMTNIHAEGDTIFPMYTNPKIMLQSTEIDGGLMIADTGCQRQVAGSAWHVSQQNHIKPLKVVEFPDTCSFSFGPHKGMPSTARYAYPAGLGGAAITLGISRVDCDAPALFSRPAFEALGAVADIGKGVMFYRALNKKTQLFLARGHLAIRIDEWPEEPFDRPMQFSTKQIADVWIPGPSDELRLKTSKLQESCSPVRRPPHAASSCTTSMAEQLALPPDQLPGDALHGEAAGDPVRGLVTQAAHQGLHAGHVLPATDGDHYAEDGDGSTDAKGQPVELRLRPGEVQAPQRSSTLWSREDDGAHMRSMWRTMGRRHWQRQGPGSMCAEGLTDGEDSFGAWQDDGEEEPQRQELSGTSGKLERNSFEKIGKGIGKGLKFLGWCAAAAIALALPPDSQTKDIDQTIYGTTHSPELGHGGLRGRCQHGEHGEQKGPFYGLLSEPGALRGDALRRERPAGVATETKNEATATAGARGRGGRARAERDGGAPMDSSVSSDRRGRRCSRGRGRQLEPNARLLQGSADTPLSKEERGCHVLRQGLQKRLLGTIKAVRQCLNVEAQLYQQQAALAQNLRKHRCDLVEIYGGFANITAEGIAHGLRVLQPVDKVHGIDLDTKKDHEILRRLLRQHKPFLVIWEIRCDPWPRIQHLNYTAEQLEKLRDEHRLALREMAKTICELHLEGCHFLLENPWGTDFWSQDELQPVLRLEGAQLKRGSMCNFGLRGRGGLLLRKDTGWCSDLPLVLNEVAKPCSGQHEHEECLGGNAKRAQVYTKSLARAVVRGLLAELHQHGDERFFKHVETYGQWTTSLSSPTASFSNWTSTSAVTVWYAEINKDAESWRPILKEVSERLNNKVQATATVKPDTAFFEQISCWCPGTSSSSRSPEHRR